MDTEQRFIELIEHHKRIIYKVCYVYAPGRGQIDDYFQEVVLALWRGFPDFRGESKTATWVYRIALYTCISFVRRRMRRPQSVRLSVDLVCDDDMAGPRAARRAVCGDLTLGPARPGADPAVARRTSRRGDRRHHGPVSRQCGRETDRIRCKLRKMYNR